MYITHYCPNEKYLFKKITEYNQEDVKKVLVKLCKYDGTAYERFRNFEMYYPQRVETERWLYSEAKSRGIIPETDSPWYFVLGESAIISAGFGAFAFTYQINLDNISNKHITFTLGDSMGVFLLGNTHRRVYNMEEIINMHLNNDLTDIEAFNYLQEKHKYVEAQLWTSQYFK